MNRNYAQKLCLATLVIGTVFGGVALGQRPHGGPRTRHERFEVPFPFIDKTIKFPVSRLSRAHFNEMGANWTFLSKGFTPGVKADQQVIMLSYGFKKGGVVRVFETPAVPGISPVALTEKINSSGLFPNVKRGPWKFSPMVIRGVFVVPGCESPDALATAISDLKSAPTGK